MRDVRGEGFYVCARVPDGDDVLLNIATTLGRPVAEARDGILIKRISPVPTGQAAPNTLSSIHGMDGFPFHTDGAYWRVPPRFILLYCENPGSGERSTTMIDTATWHLSQDEQRVLRSEVWRVTRIRKPFLCTHASDHGIRSDYACMRPATRRGAAREIVENAISASPVIRIVWERGKLLIIDNNRMLHARGHARRPDPDRALKRVLIA